MLLPRAPHSMGRPDNFGIIGRIPSWPLQSLTGNLFMVAVD